MSVTIILLLTGIGVTTFSGLIKTKNVSIVKNELSSWLNLSRSLAITGQLSNKSLGLKYVRVTFSDANKKLTVDGVNTGTPATILNFFVKTFGKETDIDDVTITPDITTFGFNKGSGRLLDGSGNFIDGPLKIVVQSSGVSEVIIVSDLGVINEK